MSRAQQPGFQRRKPFLGHRYTPGIRPEALREAALTAAERGWHVFPLAPNGKRPVVEKWEDRATVDLDRIARCWTPTSDNNAQWNIGIACRPSGLVVVDLDVAKPDDTIPAEYEQTAIRSGRDVLADLEGAHGDLPDTYTVDTPSGGRHLYFDAAGELHRNTASRLGWLIDTRGDGGYVVAAGSSIDGASYTALDADASTARLPEWIGEQLHRSEPGHDLQLPEDEQRRRNYVTAAVRNEIARVLNSAPHTHNNALFVASASLGRIAAAGDLDVPMLQGALLAAAEAVGQPHSEATATIASGLRNGGANRPAQSRTTHVSSDPDHESSTTQRSAAMNDEHSNDTTNLTADDTSAETVTGHAVDGPDDDGSAPAVDDPIPAVEPPSAHASAWQSSGLLPDADDIEPDVQVGAAQSICYQRLPVEEGDSYALTNVRFYPVDVTPAPDEPEPSPAKEYAVRRVTERQVATDPHDFDNSVVWQDGESVTQYDDGGVVFDAAEVAEAAALAAAGDHTADEIGWDGRPDRGERPGREATDAGDNEPGAAAGSADTWTQADADVWDGGKGRVGASLVVADTPVITREPIGSHGEPAAGSDAAEGGSTLFGVTRRSAHPSDRLSEEQGRRRAYDEAGVRGLASGAADRGNVLAALGSLGGGGHLGRSTLFAAHVATHTAGEAAPRETSAVPDTGAGSSAVDPLDRARKAVEQISERQYTAERTSQQVSPYIGVDRAWSVGGRTVEGEL